MNFIITLIAIDINLPRNERKETRVYVSDAQMEGMRAALEGAYAGVIPEFKTKGDVEAQAAHVMALILGGTEEVDGVEMMLYKVEWDRVAKCLRDVLAAELLHPAREMTEEEVSWDGDGFPWDGEPEETSDAQWRKMEHQSEARQTGFGHQYTDEEDWEEGGSPGLRDPVPGSRGDYI